MEIDVLGEGKPEYAVVGGIHPDERCGKEIIESFRADPPHLRQPLKLVIAHMRALEADSKYVDEDLNRAFPGDPHGKTYEKRLAAQLLEELEDCRVLDLHSTVSQNDPFALLQRFNDTTKRLAATTGLETVVDIREASGGLIQYVNGVSVECGRKHSQTAVSNGKRILKNFLGNNGLIDDGGAPVTNPTLYRVTESVSVTRNADIEVFCENFALVRAGEPYARVDGRDLTHETDFYPVLMSEGGYEDRGILGFRAEKIGDLLDESEFHALR